MELTPDIRYAFRTLKKSPLFTAVAVLSLAIGIGANTAMFTVINAVLLRPTPDVFVVKSENLQRGLSFQILSAPEIADYRAETSVFSVVAAHRTGTAYLSDGMTERINVHSIDEHFLNAVEARPELGRSFSEADMQTGAPRVVILQNAFWRDRFGADEHVIGRSITIGDAPHEIVGVMPRGFADPYAIRTDLWVPLVPRPAQVNRGTRFINAIARLQPNVSIAQAQERMTALSRALAEKYPEDHEGWSARLVSLQEHITGDQRLPLIILVWCGLCGPPNCCHECCQSDVFARQLASLRNRRPNGARGEPVARNTADSRGELHPRFDRWRYRIGRWRLSRWRSFSATFHKVCLRSTQPTLTVGCCFSQPV